jgi:Fur family transcriptional regulator, zinc uptake regulator
VIPIRSFPFAAHQHEQCVAAILADARRLCECRHVRLTEQRRRVLEIVASSHAAIGAYDIMDRLATSGRRPAPITVYRALDFLIDQGLVHRLASLNAYIACLHASAEHGAQFLICRDCGTIGEMTSPAVDRAIVRAASSAGFAVALPVVEVSGVCAHCHAGSSPNGDGNGGSQR